MPNKIITDVKILSDIVLSYIPGINSKIRGWFRLWNLKYLCVHEAINGSVFLRCRSWLGSIFIQVLYVVASM